MEGGAVGRKALRWDSCSREEAGLLGVLSVRRVMGNVIHQFG